MKYIKIEYIDGVKVTTYTKVLQPKPWEKTFPIRSSKYSVWTNGRKRETLGLGFR